MPRAPLPSESLALAESEGLLRFAAENVKDLPPTFVSTICAALDAQHASAWDQKIATEFWCAYNSLCTLIKPVTVDTLETNFRKLDPPKWHFWAKVPKAVSLSKRTATRYLTLLMVLLVVSVILGFMVSTATSLRSEILKTIDEGNQVSDRMVSKIDELEPIVSTREFSTVEAKHKAAIALLQSQLAQLYFLIDQMLHKADVASRVISFGLVREPYTLGTLTSPADIASLRDEIRNYKVVRRDTVNDLDNVQIINGVITSSVLPIILGIMGACAYVVRLISDQIKDTTFSQTSPIRHLVRVALGGLAGVVIGFGGVVSAGNLSSSALAFIAGYAVEPVFATFDSIAEKFRR